MQNNISCVICGNYRKFKNPKISYMSNIKHKKVFTILNYIELFLILASTITGYILLSAFASLLGFPIGITSSTKGLKICAITA